MCSTAATPQLWWRGEGGAGPGRGAEGSQDKIRSSLATEPASLWLWGRELLAQLGRQSKQNPPTQKTSPPKSLNKH